MAHAVESGVRPEEPQELSPPSEFAQTPVIALGAGMAVLQVITLFARASIPCYTVCPDDDFVRYSRWYHALPLKPSSLSSANLAEALYELPFQHAVLMPCSDDWLQRVAALPPSVTRDFPASSPSPEIVETMVNKWRFAQALELAGVPHPRTHLASSTDDLASIPASEFSDAFLKPLLSLPFCQRYHVKGFRLLDRDQALAIMQDKEFPILLQEFIPGPPTTTYFIEGFVDRHGNACGMLARQRLRMFPPGLGNSTLSVTVPLATVQAAEQSLRKLLAFLRYRGIFNAEFKFDQRDGLFKLLEINARPWWYIEFAARCGVDVCAMAYRDALDLPVEPVSGYQLGRNCVYLINDIRAWWRQRRHGASLRSWAQPWSAAEVTPFHWNDPLPALAFPGSMFRQRHKK